MSDIFDGLALIRVEFLKAELHPPSAIYLDSHDEGMRFLSAIRQQNNWTATLASGQLGNAIQGADGSVYMELEVMGMKVRWPANRIAMPNGSWTHI